MDKDYKKLYKEALERAKELRRQVNANETILVNSDLNTIFPELRESEDEKIRKAILGLVKQSSHILNPMNQKSMISWLEKQKDTNVLIQEASEKAYTEGMRVERKHWFEKQVEQKPNYCHHEVDLSECSEEYRKAYYDGWNNCNMQHSQCKSELDDVVKCLINGMKFYYEDNEKATWGTDKWSMPVKHIIEVLEKQGEQKPVEQDAETNDLWVYIREWNDKFGRLPKDEDELASCVYYVMKRQKSADNYCQKNCKGYRDTGGRCFADGECEAKKKAEQKPTWSEEDEKRINSIISSIEYCSEQYPDRKEYEKGIDWIKSLKDRVQPQPKQEWSVEDRKNLNSVKWIIENSDNLDRVFETINSLEYIKKYFIDWLESLKPQKHWKPSEYDISLLEEIARNIRNNIRPFCSEVSALEDLIKNIKTL